MSGGGFKVGLPEVEDFVLLRGEVGHLAELREALWEAVSDAGTGALDLPRRLADAWDDTRKQREYLNARDDGHAAIYYAHAYKY